MKDKNAPTKTPVAPSGSWRRQLAGMLAGMALTLAISPLLPPGVREIGLGRLVVWGGIAGSVLASLGRFEQAGAVITGRQDRALNVALGMTISALLVIALAFVINSFLTR